MNIIKQFYTRRGCEGSACDIFKHFQAKTAVANYCINIKANNLACAADIFVKLFIAQKYTALVTITCCFCLLGGMGLVARQTFDDIGYKWWRGLISFSLEGISITSVAGQNSK